MTGHILFLAHRLPFPPDRGDKIRSHHVLRHLAGLAPVHVATFADDERDLDAEVDLATLARSYRLVERSKSLAMAGCEALLRREPVSLAAFRDPALAEYVLQVLADYPIETIYVFSGQMGQYVPDTFPGRVICDFVDVDSAKFAAYADRRSWWRGAIDRREARLLSAEESRLAARADVSLLISEEEAALFRSQLPLARRDQCDVQTLRNGVDTQFYDPATVVPEPRLVALDGPRLIFTGQMDYAPNIAAARRAAVRIMPRLRAVLPNASLHIVGRNPPTLLTALSGREGIHVWGAVEDVRPWLAGCDLALVPLEIARGVQNKVLEAMAMGLPVVLTPAAATGIGATDQRHLTVAGDDEDLASTAAALIAHPPRARKIGQDAREFVIERLSWEAMLAPLDAMIGRGLRIHSRAA
jgi:sugar transferase (PEP-CTERM/EpsH1 system associated)